MMQNKFSIGEHLFNHSRSLGKINFDQVEINRSRWHTKILYPRLNISIGFIITKEATKPLIIPSSQIISKHLHSIFVDPTPHCLIISLSSHVSHKTCDYLRLATLGCIPSLSFMQTIHY